MDRQGFVRRRANSCGSRSGSGCQTSSSSHDGPIAVQKDNANLDANRLRVTLEEWQNANAQWQSAYAAMQQRCFLLEADNRQLQEVIEAAESGPNMNGRFVARLARQNWRLGQEITQRGSGNASSDSSPASAPKAHQISQGDANNSGGESRPEGVKRLPLPLNKKGQDDSAATYAAAACVVDDESSSEPSSDIEEPNNQQHACLDSALKQSSMARCADSGHDERNVLPAEEDGPSQQSVPSPQHTRVEKSTTSTAKSMLVTVSFAIVSILGLGLMATITLWRLFASNNGDDFEL